MRVALLAVLGVLAGALTVQAGEATVTDKLMTKGFKKDRRAGDAVNIVLIHFSSNVIASPTDPYDVDKVIALYAASNSSAHYLIGRDGKIYRLVDEKDTAYHAGEGVWKDRTNDLNRTSIGVELLAIGTADEMKKGFSMKKADYDKISATHRGFTAAQYKALSQLLKDIKARNPGVLLDREHVIGHDEYAKDRKVDPGSLFDWKKIGL